MKKVLTFGTFDHFHAGHESYLRQAKIHGDYLITVVARDETVRKIKGELPDYDEKKRLNMVKDSSIPDKVVLGSKDDKYDVIRKYKPKVIALGYDQFAFTTRLGKFLIDEGMDTKIIRTKSYQPRVYKTSIIKKNI